MTGASPDGAADLRRDNGGKRSLFLKLAEISLNISTVKHYATTAALDPKTAIKVLDATGRIVRKDRLTTLMITHNMRDAVIHVNRLTMMYEGDIALDISGEEKKLTVEQLLAKFGQAAGSDETDNKLLLS